MSDYQGRNRLGKSPITRHHISDKVGVSYCWNVSTYFGCPGVW